MDPDSAFDAYLNGALETFGIEADDVERAVITGVWKIYQEGMDLLTTADLSEVAPEPTPDLSRPPAE